MKIELSDDFNEVDFVKDISKCACIEAVFISVARGEHYVTLSRRLLDYLLSARQHFSLTVRGVLVHVKEEYADSVAMLRTIQAKVVVSATSEFPRRISADAWEVPAKHVAEKGIARTVLLAENSHDGDIFIHAAEHYKLSHGYRTVNVCARSRNGNGASIVDELSRVSLSAEEFCVCVTDSDKLSPNGGPAHSARECKKVALASAWPVMHEETGVRELENCIPLGLVEQAVFKLPNWATFNDAIARADANVFSFADIKEGTTVRWVDRLKDKSPEQGYWHQQCKLVNNALPADYECLGNCCKQGPCTCFVIPPLASKLAHHVREYLSSNSRHATFKESKNSPNFSNWLRLGRAIFEASIARPPMRL